MRALIFLAIFCSVSKSQETLFAAQREILKHLFENQTLDKKSAPVFRFETDNATKIDVWSYEVRIYRMKVIELDEPRELLSVSLHTIQSWMDLRLRWNWSDFGAIYSMYLRQDEIWTPPFEIFSAYEVRDHRDPNFRAIQVFYTGTMSTHIPLSVTTNCKLNMDNFPFDTQICDIRGGLAIMHPAFVKTHFLISNKTGSSLCEMGNSVWDVIKIETGQVELPGGYSGYAPTRLAILRLTLKRNPLFYMYMIVLPTFFINMIAIFGVFIKKSSAMERLTIVLTHIMTMTFILGLIAEKIPKTEEIPLLGRYIIVGLCEMMIASISQSFMNNWFMLAVLQLVNVHSFLHMILKYLEFEQNHGDRGTCYSFTNNDTIFYMD